MPPLKRARSSSGLEEPDEDDDGRTVLTDSSFQSRKRLRRSNSLISEEETDKSEDDGIGSIPSTWPLDDEDELELRATQIIQDKYSFRSNEPNVPAEHGILERVECYNFMCHDHFYVELGPLINFIVGKNGSGKSAILTAITLCLGGKASATNRGQSLKSFIKEGKENASIIVRIKNQGEGSYMPDDYGKSIIVERHFSKNGTSGFKIKAANGRIVSTKKSELDSITDYFNLQIDNPMNVLSQDMARQFLSSSSAADKYKFFVRGVQLEQLDQDYRLIEEFVDQIEEKLESKNEDIKILRNRRDMAKQKLDISDRHEYLRQRIRNLRSQMAWAQVEEQEKTRDAFEHELTKMQEKIAAKEAEVGGFDAAFEEAENESESAAGIVRGATVDLQRVENEKGDIKSRLDEEMGERHDLQAQQRQIREYLKAAELRVKETQQKVAQETQRLSELSGGSYSRKQEQLQQAENDASMARQRYEDHQRDSDLLHKELQKAENEVKLAAAPIAKKKADVEQAETLLRNLTRDGGVKHSGFHERMPLLLRTIQQQKGSFRRSPVGPIGHYVSLLKPEWSSILENSLGTTLNSFVVTSKSDMNILSNIMQKVNCVCPIFIGSDGRIDTAKHEPDHHFNTALRVLQIDNELVRRQLIINHGIEQMLLIENLEEATSVLFDSQRPRNVKRCYCIDPSNRRRGIHLSYSRSGEPSQAPVPAFNGSPRMKSDLASQIRIQRDVVEDLRRELRNLEDHLRSSRSHLESCKQALVRHDRKAKDLKVAQQRIEDRTEELRDALDKETAGDGHLEVLQAALREAEEEKRLNEGSYNDSVRAMDEIMQKMKRTGQEIAAKDEETSALRESLRIAQSEELRVSDKRRKILSDKNATVRQIDDLKQEMAEIERKREQIISRIVDYSEKASLVSPRVTIDEGETPSSLDKKLDRFHKDLQRFHEQVGASRDQIATEARETNASYERARNQVLELETLANIFKKTLSFRKHRWVMFRSYISCRAKAQFTYLLSERSFRGRLLTDHEGKLLDLQVEPDITKDSSAGRGAKTLSGGEKSFSQVCLLLALWEAMGSPIRCLDELYV
ncbi:hypothetical protein MAP00_008150 [Monascus purpureus]|nr:hypothetical protein MAP00_008150 [Monascus purpureus]